MMDFGGRIEFDNGELNILEYELSEYTWENMIRRKYMK